MWCVVWFLLFCGVRSAVPNCASSGNWTSCEPRAADNVLDLCYANVDDFSRFYEASTWSTFMQWEWLTSMVTPKKNFVTAVVATGDRQNPKVHDGAVSQGIFSIIITIFVFFWILGLFAVFIPAALSTTYRRRVARYVFCSKYFIDRNRVQPFFLVAADKLNFLIFSFSVCLLGLVIGFCLILFYAVETSDYQKRMTCSAASGLYESTFGFPGEEASGMALIHDGFESFLYKLNVENSGSYFNEFFHLNIKFSSLLKELSDQQKYWQMVESSSRNFQDVDQLHWLSWVMAGAPQPDKFSESSIATILTGTSLTVVQEGLNYWSNVVFLDDASYYAKLMANTSIVYATSFQSLEEIYSALVTIILDIIQGMHTATGPALSAANSLPWVSIGVGTLGLLVTVVTAIALAPLGLLRLGRRDPDDVLPWVYIGAGLWVSFAFLGLFLLMHGGALVYLASWPQEGCRLIWQNLLVGGQFDSPLMRKFLINANVNPDDPLVQRLTSSCFQQGGDGNVFAISNSGNWMGDAGLNFITVYENLTYWFDVLGSGVSEPLKKSVNSIKVAGKQLPNVTSADFPSVCWVMANDDLNGEEASTRVVDAFQLMLVPNRVLFTSPFEAPTPIEDPTTSELLTNISECLGRSLEIWGNSSGSLAKDWKTLHSHIDWMRRDTQVANFLDSAGTSINLLSSWVNDWLAERSCPFTICIRSCGWERSQACGCDVHTADIIIESMTVSVVPPASELAFTNEASYNFDCSQTGCPPFHLDDIGVPQIQGAVSCLGRVITPDPIYSPMMNVMQFLSMYNMLVDHVKSLLASSNVFVEPCTSTTGITCLEDFVSFDFYLGHLHLDQGVVELMTALDAVRNTQMEMQALLNQTMIDFVDLVELSQCNKVAEGLYDTTDYVCNEFAPYWSAIAWICIFLAMLCLFLCCLSFGVWHYWRDRYNAERHDDGLLLQACLVNDTAMVIHLVENRARNPRTTIDGNDNSCMHYAARGGSNEVLTYLISQNCDINRLNVLGYSVLQVAVAEQRVATCGLLLSHGANPNTLDPFGDSPLHFAARTGDLELVEKLLDKGCDPEITDKSKILPEDLARDLNLSQVQTFLQTSRTPAASMARSDANTELKNLILKAQMKQELLGQEEAEHEEMPLRASMLNTTQPTATPSSGSNTRRSTLSANPKTPRKNSPTTQISKPTRSPEH